MRYVPIACLFALILTGCFGESSSFHNLPNSTFTQLECLDVNGDHQLNAQDAADPGKLASLDAAAPPGGTAAFLDGVDIPLDPAKQDTACHGKNPDWGPEFLVARANGSGAAIDCQTGAQPVLLVGVGGAVSNLKRHGDAAGVTQTVDALQQALQHEGVPSFAIISGQAMIAGTNVHIAMEDWLTHAVGVYLGAYPCLRVALLGHSHGAITVDVVGSRLEGTYGDRILSVVDIDRVEVLYDGDLQAWPSSAPVLNIYEKNDNELSGSPRDGGNVENWDASGEKAPENGDKGGAQKQVNHTTIDNSASVRQRIVDTVIQHAARAQP